VKIPDIRNTTPIINDKKKSIVIIEELNELAKK
jgi:hypothetical protein